MDRDIEIELFFCVTLLKLEFRVNCTLDLDYCD